MGGDNRAADNDRAARWFLEAAELGVTDSQYNLGILTAKGAGVPQSLEESYKWFALVAKTGDRDAAAKRDEVAKALRPEQLEKAKQAAELWKARQVIPEANVAEIPEEWTEGDPQTASVDVEKAVRNIQAILNNNGYDAGPADGMMGAKTKAAIKAFQADNGMQADGEVDDELVKALLERN
jgi:localization factor PodJL